LKGIVLIDHVVGIAKFLIGEENSVEMEEIGRGAIGPGREEGKGDRCGEGALHMIGEDAGEQEVTIAIGLEGEVQNEEDAGSVAIQIGHLGVKVDEQEIIVNLNQNRNLDLPQPKKVGASP
jgi:hypothetical protein